MQRRDVGREVVAAETDRLLATVSRLAAAQDDDPLGAPSLCPGWTRGHVLTHLARNADALVRVASVATEGRRTTMYDSVESRDADIEAGARRPADEQHDDLAASAERLDDQLQRLAGVTDDQRGTRVERTPGGQGIPVGAVPFLRLRELVFHHVDLDAGFGFGDAPPDVVTLFLEDAVERLRGDDAPDVVLVADEGGTHELGAATTRITGPRAGLLLWLARGRTDGVVADGPLPTLPHGG